MSSRRPNGKPLSSLIACAAALVALFLGARTLPAQAAGRQEVVIWMWTAHVTDLYQSWYERVKAWYEAENPGATLRFEFVDTAAGEKLTAAVAGGAPPDVSLASIHHARTFYEAGMFTPLNRYIEATAEMHLDQFLPSSVVFGQKDGVIFGLPWSLEARAVLYNKVDLIEAGLDDRPTALTTWDDLVAYAQRLVKKDAGGAVTHSGMVLGRGPSNFAAYLYANGGSFYNEAGTAVAFNDARGIEALEFMARFYREYEVTRPGAAWTDIRSGTASMVIGDTSSIPGFQAQNPDFTSWLQMAPIPRGPQGEHTSTVSWSNMFVIPRGAKNPDLGWNFIKLWLSPEATIERFLHFGGAYINSARRDLLRSPQFARSVEQYPYLAVSPEIFNNARPYPYIRFSQINAQMAPLLTQAENGTLAAAAALAEAERIANAILQQ